MTMHGCISRLLVLAMACLAVQSQANTTALSINNVSHSPQHIEVSSDAPVTIRFSINARANGELNVYDDRDILIKTVHASLARGDNSFNWDLTDNAGRKVPPEAYRYTIVAKRGNDSTTYDISDLTGKDFIEVDNTHWDAETGAVSFAIQRNARVSINIGILGGGPLLGSILDWVPLPRGRHKIQWNGMDPSGRANIGKIDDIHVVAQAYALSSNTIIVGPVQNSSNYIEDLTWPRHVRERHYLDKPRLYNYPARPAGGRLMYRINISLPDSLKRTPDGAPVLSGVVPVSMHVSDNEISRLQQDRFEPILFVDGKFVSELESGFFPFTWKLDAAQFTRGKHYITINVRGYDGQYGTASEYVYMESE